ncbi:MAG: SEC-C domain-containing protein [Clostridiales Family XIII bacterium]|jgi:hypothetical protein|nr:SEC-C domain-containing protein [Clostridiales Family XIII bacterium]
MKAYQIKVVLQGVKPPVWRRLIVPAGIAFSQFKVVLTEAMGWFGGYFYVFLFEDEGLLLIHPDEEDPMLENLLPADGDCESKDARETAIDDFLREGVRFRFDCDFGEVWSHEIKVEKLLEDYPRDYPRVIKYAGNCPPEDIGGPDAYAALCRVQRDPADPNHENAVQWSEQFCFEYDVKSVNEELRDLPSHEYRDIVERFDFDAEDDADASERGLTPVGPNSFLSIADRIHTMREDELKKAFENPETIFGYMIFDRPAILDLRSLLASFKLRDLQKLASEMRLSGRSRLKKGELVNAVYDCYMDSKLLTLLMNQMSAKEIKVLHDIMHTGVYYVEDTDFPYDFALTLLYHNIITAFYREDSIVIVAFREFRKKYDEALEEMKELFSGILTELDEYACAAVNLYGAISMDDFVRIYLDLTEGDLDEEAVRRVLPDLIGDASDSETQYRLRGNLLISDELDDCEDDELEELVEGARAYPLYIPPRERFLEYADWLYFEETPAHERFVEFIREQAGQNIRDKTSYKLLVGEICSALRQWAPMQECFDILESFDIKLRDLKNIKRATKLIAQMNENTRIWGKSGLTPNELRSRKPANTSRKAPERKIGRNEPCPCGSGKKYKHCCGKDL